MASLTTIKPGDIVEVDRKGRRFYALVKEKQPRLLSRIEPLDSRITYTTATSHEVVRHWRLTKNVRKSGTSAGHDAD